MSGDSGVADFERAETALEELSSMLRGYETGTLDSTWIEDLFSSCRQSFDWPERRQTLLLLMLAGVDTSISMLANCLLPMLLSGRAFGAELLSEYASDSSVQMTCPIKFTMREVVAPLLLAGCQFAVGDRVLLSWYGGNKHLADDGSPWESRGFAFGVGIHSCLGKAVAMHQLHACFCELERVGRPLVLDAAVTYNSNLCFHYPSSVPARWSGV
jgi:cytochrome P450